jgi:hypothetical protein
MWKRILIQKYQSCAKKKRTKSLGKNKRKTTLNCLRNFQGKISLAVNPLRKKSANGPHTLPSKNLTFSYTGKFIYFIIEKNIF